MRNLVQMTVVKTRPTLPLLVPYERHFPSKEITFSAIGLINLPLYGSISLVGTKFKGDKKSWKIKITQQGEFHAISWENLLDFMLEQSFSLGKSTNCGLFEAIT